MTAACNCETLRENRVYLSHSPLAAADLARGGRNGGESSTCGLHKDQWEAGHHHSAMEDDQQRSSKDGMDSCKEPLRREALLWMGCEPECMDWKCKPGERDRADFREMSVGQPRRSRCGARGHPGRSGCRDHHEGMVCNGNSQDRHKVDCLPASPEASSAKQAQQGKCEADIRERAAESWSCLHEGNGGGD